MGPEELGSVYESLLELVPEVDITAREFGFVGLTSEGSTQQQFSALLKDCQVQYVN